jgi:rhamnogalacturonyl hydrolase YesR
LLVVLFRQGDVLHTALLGTRHLIHRPLRPALHWFADRFAEGATTKNVNTMAPFLTLAYRFEETGCIAHSAQLSSHGRYALHPVSSKR